MFATDVNFAKAQIVVSFFKLELFSMEMSEERCIDFIRHALVLTYKILHLVWILEHYQIIPGKRTISTTTYDHLIVQLFKLHFLTALQSLITVIRWFCSNFAYFEFSTIKSIFKWWPKNREHMGSGCGSVGRVAASEPEVRGSNTVIGEKIISNIFVFCQLYWKDKKEEEAGNGPFYKKSRIR